jgi:hypothetical protein
MGNTMQVTFCPSDRLLSDALPAIPKLKQQWKSDILLQWPFC